MKVGGRILLFLSAVLAAVGAVAQTSSELMISPQTSEIITPTPTSAQQIHYQSPQPSLATGAVNLSVPLYTIEAEGLSIPFTLSYHTSGIKPLDDPNPCGYGWSLLPALKITRTIRGRADEKFEYWGDKLLGPPEIPDPKVAYACMARTVPALGNFRDEIRERYDAEKDIFTISLPSGTYNRIYHKNDDGSVSFIGGGADDEIVVTADADLHDFYVRDAQGFTYHFGDKYIEKPVKGSDDFSYSPTCWGIIDIGLPSSSRIDFNWTQYSPPYKIIVGGDTYCDMFDANFGSNCGPQESLFVKSEALYNLYSNVPGIYTNRITLSKVTFPGGTVNIDYTDGMITYFKVVSDTNIVKTIWMRHGTGKVESLFLKEVNISGEGSYKFDYDPQRFEDKYLLHRQDWWGYYNGKSPYGTPGEYCLTPYLEFQAYYHTDLCGFKPLKSKIGHANRTVDEVAMQAGILKKITYPTGGFSTFEYETHRFPATKEFYSDELISNTDPKLDKGGGLRVTKICTYAESDDPRPHVRTYQYDSVNVTAVPSAATFVSVSPAIGLYKDLFTGEYKTRRYRRFHVGYCSDYMQNHIGEEAIWYSKVTELYGEGKIVHRFGYSAPKSEETRLFGKLFPRNLYNIFTHGILPLTKEIYEIADGVYKKIESITFEYEKLNKSSIINAHIQRIIINTVGPDGDIPDFVNGTYARHLLSDNGFGWADYFINIYRNGFFDGEHPYEVNNYPIHLQSDRLKSKTVTQHLENGDFSRTETYTYKPWTSIVTSVETTTSADKRTERIDIIYPSESGSDAECAMIDANIIGVPVQTTYTFGSASVAVRRDMARYGNRVFRPAGEWQSRGTNEWLVGSYDYDSHGNLRQYTGMDFVPTTYLWGYSYRHPVYSIRGITFKEIRQLNSSSVLNGSAETEEIKLPAYNGYRMLVTKALWKPLVGMTSLCQPCGLTTTYDYDYAGRLVRESIDGYGPVKEYSYHIDAYNWQTRKYGLNYTTHSIYQNVNGHAIQEIFTYDGLGREISWQQKTPAPENTDEEPAACGFTTVFTEYDAMDRPFRKWAPVINNNLHPAIEDIKASALDFYGTEHAYGTTFYEASPRGRVCGSRKAGDEWHRADRRTSVRYLVNTSSGDYACPDCYTTSETSRYIVTNQRYYPAGALTVEEVSDEENHVTMTFTDRRGKTVMIREGVPGDWNDTRFVYNDYGDLLFVIQPQSTGNIRKTACFRYEYDSRGNCTLKAVPGGPQTSYRYDSHNRLFAEQDGLMKNDNQWLIHHYDYLGRPAFSAYADISKADVESLCGRAFTVFAPGEGSSLATHTGGYVCPEELSSKAKYAGLAEAHYYDSYAYTSGLPERWRSFCSPSYFPSPRSSTVGLETATAAGSHLRVKMYDEAGRVIREAYGDMTQNPEQETHYRYNYKGEITGQLDRTFAPESIIRDISHTYYSSGHLRETRVTQDGKTATITRYYDGTGQIAKLELGGNIVRTFGYNVNGWQTSSVATAIYNPATPLVPADSLIVIKSTGSSAARIGKTEKTVIEEQLHYADEADGTTPRYDGKISARRRDNMMTAYDYDNHGRLASSLTSYITTGPIRPLAVPDYSTAYTYDRNANITSLSRQGIIDNVGRMPVYGLHSRYSMTYAGNQLSRMEIEREGEDYEGRTGVGATGTVTNFWYDVNGNMGRDMSRGIMETRYNRLNLPTDIYFRNGHRQAIVYDGFGQKRQVSYSQTDDPMLGAMMGVPEDSAYTLQGRRSYLGPHVFVSDSLEYSAFPGGYFTPKGTYYYITDWQGNNIAVFSDKGRLEQQTTYYPYGEPVVEPAGQRYLFGGKEREHAGGRNSSDFGPRCLTPTGSWSAADRMSESFYPLSPFSYCGGDPINRIDPTGLAWHVIDSISGGEPYFEWVDDKLSYDKNGKLLPNFYEQAILFSPTDKKVDNENYKIGTSTATVYKADGTTEDFDACTVPSDDKLFATVPAGRYEAKVGYHKQNSPDKYKALRLGDVGTVDFRNNSIELGKPNPSKPETETTKAYGINIHKAGKRNYTGTLNNNGRINGVSEGCLLIDRNSWPEFIKIFESSMQINNIVGVILIR